MLLGQAVCHRYNEGDTYLAAVATMAEAGMTVENAVRWEEIATSTVCPEYESKSD